MDCYEIARDMLGLNRIADIPQDVYRRLTAIDELVRQSGGTLRSRQLIATVIVLSKGEGK